MTKSLILLILLAMLASATVTAEQNAESAQSEAVETEFVETEAAAEETGREGLLADGEWLEIPEMSADIYLPAGWTLTQADENGFTASAGADEAEEDASKGDAPAKIVLTKAVFEDDDIVAYADANYEAYALEEMFEGQAVVVDDAENDAKTIAWLYDESTLVTLTLTPASDEALAESLIEIAGTFAIYATEE